MATSTNQIRCLVYNEAVRGSFHMVDLHSTFLLIRSLRCLLSSSSQEEKFSLESRQREQANPNHVVTDGEEGKLFKSGQFGTFYPEALQRIMWWFLSLYVGNFSKSLFMRRSFSWHCLQVSLLREQL